MAGGTDGLMAPSFAVEAGPAKRDVMFWTWSDIPPHKVAVIDD
jgi:hypothetical protein